MDGENPCEDSALVLFKYAYSVNRTWFCIGFSPVQTWQFDLAVHGNVY